MAVALSVVKCVISVWLCKLLISLLLKGNILIIVLHDWIRFFPYSSFLPLTCSELDAEV